MNQPDDDRFRPRPGPPRQRGGDGQRFVSLVRREVSKAGQSGRGRGRGRLFYRLAPQDALRECVHCAAEELVEAAPEARLRVVVNRLRPAAAGVSPRSQVEAVWSRYASAGIPLAAFLPWDPAAADRALLGGQVLAEAAPNSALRRALAERDGRRRAAARDRILATAAQSRTLPRREALLLSRMPA